MANLPKREIKDIIHGDVARDKSLAGAKQMYEAVSSTYGPAGHNVILGMPYGDPVLTRDGVTVAKRVILKDRAENDAAQILKQASEKTNRSAGDGTTATVVLGYHLFQGGHKLLSAGESGMALKRQIADDAKTVIDFLNSKSLDGKDKLLQVATVSAGDPAIGALVADTLNDVGESGGITIREQNYPVVDVEKVNGYYFDKGFFALDGTAELDAPLIFVTHKPIADNSDMIPLLSKVINGTNKKLVIVGDVRANSEAMNTLMLNVMQQKLSAVVIPPPAFNDEGLNYLQDIALYVGAKLFIKGDDIEAIKESDEYFGTAERVQVTQSKATIFKGAGDAQAVVDRAAEINAEAKKEKESHRKNTLEQRFAKLTGKTAIVNVGGSTPTEMEELRYRVEDAIEATKSAMADGVLPGGGTLLVKASKLDISPLFKKALLNAFRKLMNNADEPADFRVEQIKRAKDGYGFNLRAMTDEPVNLVEEGIFDATRAVVQTVENASSAAGSLLTIGAFVEPIEGENEESQS